MRAYKQQQIQITNGYITPPQRGHTSAEEYTDRGGAVAETGILVYM